MELSIIIPVYNGAATIGRCLDSIYSQGLNEVEFEVICVDDCSSDPSSVKAIEEYQYKSAPPSNLKLIRHTVNKRQGGARNTGIRAALGKWILFIDQDDYFINNSINHLQKKWKENDNLDFIMVDCVIGGKEGVMQEGNYSKMNLSQDVMSGPIFLQTQPVPWSPWCYLYKRDSLLKANVVFAENVRFEDTDFVLKYTARAKLARFCPIQLVNHVISSNQTSNFGNDFFRIKDCFEMSWRTWKIYTEEASHNIIAANAIMKHATFMRQSVILKYLWRVSYSDMKYILNKYRINEQTNNKIIDFSNRHIHLTSLILTTLKPVLFLLAWSKKLSNSIRK